MKTIYLLDLNYTLVTNSDSKKSPFIKQIEQEEYDTDLIEKLSGEEVILITARPEKYKEVTLARIKALTGFEPIDAYFNSLQLPPPTLKYRLMKDTIKPKYVGRTFFGIESNPKSRAMYKALDIKSLPKVEFMSRNIN